MNPAEPQSLGEDSSGFRGAAGEGVTLHLQRMRETLISLRSRATDLEARRKRESSQCIGVGRRAVDLGDLIDRRLKALEHPDAPSLEVVFAPIPTPCARERPLAWTISLAILLFVTLTAIWTLRSTPVAGPPMRRLSAPVTPTLASPASPPAPSGRQRAARASAASNDANAVGDDAASRPTARNSPVFELYSPKAPATPPH